MFSKIIRKGDKDWTGRGKKPIEKQSSLHPSPRSHSSFCWKKSRQNSKLNSFSHFMLPGFSVSIPKPLYLSGVCSALLWASCQARVSFSSCGIWLQWKQSTELWFGLFSTQLLLFEVHWNESYSQKCSNASTGGLIMPCSSQNFNKRSKDKLLMVWSINNKDTGSISICTWTSTKFNYRPVSTMSKFV